MKPIKLYWVLINCLIISNGLAQVIETDYTTGKQLIIKSKVLNEDRQLLISLPANYDRNIHDYPVIYVMDAEFLFDLTQSIVKIRAERNYMPRSIIVGITNNTGKRNDMALILKNKMGREFFGGYGGKSKEHVTFLKDEVIPFIEKKYRANSHRTIIGMSPTFGPVLEAFWNDSKLFKGYIILASELAQYTSSGKTIENKILASIKSGNHSGNSLYIGKASRDLLNRPIEETQAYTSLNSALKKLNPQNFKYKIEVLDEEDHYGMSVPGIQHGLETIYPKNVWNIPYKSLRKANNPAKAIKSYFNELSKQYGFEIIPNEDSFYFIGNLLGVGRRLKSSKRYPELVELLELAVSYYPNSSIIHKRLSEAYRSVHKLEKAKLSQKKSRILSNALSIKKTHKDSINTVLKKYYELNLKVFQSGSTIKDIDNIFHLFTDDFTYVHPKYGGVYTRDFLYKGYKRNQEKGSYNGKIIDIKVTNKIIGLNAIAVTKRFIKKEGGKIIEGDEQMAVFEFKEGKIVKIKEYW